MQFLKKDGLVASCSVSSRCEISELYQQEIYQGFGCCVIRDLNSSQTVFVFVFLNCAMEPRAKFALWRKCAIGKSMNSWQNEHG